MQAAAQRARAAARHVLMPAATDDIEAAFATFVQRAGRCAPRRCRSRSSIQPARSNCQRSRRAMRLPAIYSLREYVAAGGLMSYGPSISDAYRQLASTAGRILKGDEAGRLAGRCSRRKFELVHQPQDRQGARPRQCRRRCSRSPTR